MSDQLILAWTVNVAGSSFGPVQAAASLAAVPLYFDPTTDPVLGQFFGLIVHSDQTTHDATSATRTLTLDMTPGFGAPPTFPCRPITSTPPVLPYPLRKTKTLPGSFFVTNGSATVMTSATQLPSLAANDFVQFLNQEGVFYEILAVPNATSITLTVPFTGTTGNTGAFKEVAAPVTRAALYSTSELDTDAIPTTVPPIAAGPGARTAVVEYTDSTGASFLSVVSLTGKRPAPIVLDPMSVDIAEVIVIVILSVGAFGNSVGQITLVELSDDLPALPPDLPVGTGVGAAETKTGKAGLVPRTFKTMTDDAQVLISRHLAYVPPSFFTLAQQQNSKPQLSGDFFVTTDSTEVFTSMDQTSALSAGNIIEFADQMGTRYTVAAVTPKIVKLTTIYTGIDTNNTGLPNTPNNNNAQTKGNIGDAVQRKPTGATLLDPSPATPPSNNQLSGPLGQFVAPGVASPPPNPPLKPATMTPALAAPVFLSDLFTQTLQLALAGVPITAQPIAFA